MKRSHLLRGLCIATLSFAAACSSETPDVDHLAMPGLDSEVTNVDVEIKAIDHDANGLPNFLVGKIGAASIKVGAAPVEIERVMFPALEQSAAYMRLKPEELSLRDAITDKEGISHFRFQQYKNGLPVLGGEIVTHVQDGVVIAVNGSARGDYSAPIDPKLDEQAARKAAALEGGRLSDLQVAEEFGMAYRVVGEQMHLVYTIDIRGTQADGTPVHDTVHVNAEDGTILGRLPHIHSAKDRRVYSLNNGTSLPGTLKRSEGGAASADAVVNNNYDRLGVAYDMYKNMFNRDSFNNAGAALISSVHYSTNYVNAFWNGSQLVYGDGDGSTASNLANSQDVTGHELTHAVTEATSKLIYSGESGGLNEGWSDAFGNVSEWYRDGRGTLNNNYFKVGEDVWTPNTANDALRYMCDPAADGASLDYWTNAAGNQDVHYSSGIANLAFCLLVQGGTHPRGKSTISVTGIGMEKAAQIWYKAQLIMTASTNFAGAKTATEQAASQLGYSAANIDSVTAAWKAVGVGVSGGGSTTCAHDKCSTGSALASSCNSVVSTVCAADAYCCSTAWDSVCISEGRTIGKSLKCGEATGTCAHNMCTTGTKLTSGCDSAKSNCVATICAADPYCCSTGWDSVCVSEVASKCNLNCN